MPKYHKFDLASYLSRNIVDSMCPFKQEGKPS